MTQMTKRQPVMHNIKFNARFFNHSISCVKKIKKKHSTHSTRKPRRKQRCTVTHRDTPWNIVPWHFPGGIITTLCNPRRGVCTFRSSKYDTMTVKLVKLHCFEICFLSDRVGFGDVLFWNPFQTFQTSLIFSERSAEVPYGFYIAYGVLGTLLLICICAAFIVAKNSMKNTQQGGSNAAV